MFEVYADGGYNPVSNQGGWAAVVVEDNKKQSYSGLVKRTTNNRMEITAALEGVQHTPQNAEIIVYTDSQYLFGCMSRGWQRRANRDLWDLLDAAVKLRNVRWEMISDDLKNPYHKEAHNLATNLATKGEIPLPQIPQKQNKQEQRKRSSAVINQETEIQAPLLKKQDETPPQAVPAELSHIDAEGRPHMVDVTEKVDTEREAIARCEVVMLPETLARLKKGDMPKGDVLVVAQIAGILAAKKTPELIPLCHPLLLGSIKVEFNIHEPDKVEITSRVKNIGKTGVEMEALTAAAVAALTIYDMCKAVDKGMRMTNLRLVRKSGGKSGTIVLENE